jgi:hypothetical protein
MKILETKYDPKAIEDRLYVFGSKRIFQSKSR